jgi:uncharacterized protein YdaL
MNTPLPGIPSRASLLQRLALKALIALVILLTLLAQVGRAQGTEPPRALVLYDQPMGQPYQNLGKAYSIMLTNLLGHWQAQVETMPTHRYQAGAVERYDVVFYLGAWFDHPLPASLLADLASTRQTVVWFKYNLWQLARLPGFDSAARMGWRLTANRGLEGNPGAATPDFFDTVHYRGETLRKYYAWSAASGSVYADPDIGLVEIIDPARVRTLATIENRARGEQAPYVLQAGNFWYVADLPFSYIGPRDRYLVFADILHEILGESPSAALAGQAGAAPQALVRLEDVHALTRAEHLRTLTDRLSGRTDPASGAASPIPFSIALIPRYRDPLGRYNNGVPLDIRLRQAAGLRAELAHATRNGATLLMHGYSHQYLHLRNPYSAVSGDDFEFWDIVANQPLSVDSPLDWRRRIDQGIRELTDAGFSAYAFETPHYQASPNAYRAIAERFPVAYERAVYYTGDRPRLNTLANDKDFAVGQFFPYVIARDWYGRTVLPENLGNIEFDIRDIDPSSNYDYRWQDLTENARVLRAVVRNGIASFFFHPFWLETFRRPDGTAYPYDGRDEFERVLAGLQGLGYRFVDPRGL